MALGPEHDDPAVRAANRGRIRTASARLLPPNPAVSVRISGCHGKIITECHEPLVKVQCGPAARQWQTEAAGLSSTAVAGRAVASVESRCIVARPAVS